MTDHPPLRVGMIGHGMMGVWHSRNLTGLEAVPHTIAGRRAEPTQAFAAEHGYAKATIDLSAMLADPEVDAVVVASPSEAHVEHSLAAIAAGKHVLIEIPIAMDYAGATRVAEAAEASERVVAVCHPWRHRPEFIALKERLDAGEERAGLSRGPLSHPPAGECRGHGLPAELDRQHPLASRLPPDRPRLLADGRRARGVRLDRAGRCADGNAP